MLYVVLCLQAEDLKYLSFQTIEVPETLYLLFKEAKLLQSRGELWEIRKNEILAMPDPLDSLSPEEKQVFETMRSELATVCKKYVNKDQVSEKCLLATHMWCAASRRTLSLTAG